MSSIHCLIMVEDVGFTSVMEGVWMMRRLIAGLAVLGLVLAGCSSDPTASNEYVALEEELAQTEADLAEVTAERDALEKIETGVAPEDLAALIDDWYEALDRQDDSVLELYVPEGYHLYGDKRFEYDEIPGHLQAGGIEHVWITGPVLIAEDEDGRYVVTRGMRNTSSTWSNASGLSFEIVTLPDGELRIVQSAWFYDTEWSHG